MTLPHETFTALEAEAAAIVGVLLEALSDPDTAADSTVVADGLGRYIAHVERIGALAEAAGLAGLRQVCDRFREQLAVITRQAGVLGDEQRELLEEWPALIIGYLESSADAGMSGALVEYLRHPVWPAPLSESEAVGLSAQLIAPWSADAAEERAAPLQTAAGTAEPEVALPEAPETMTATLIAQSVIAEETVMMEASSAPPLVLDEALSPPESAVAGSFEEPALAIMASAGTTIAAGIASGIPSDFIFDETAPSEAGEAEPATVGFEPPKAPEVEESVSVETMPSPMEAATDAILPETRSAEVEVQFPESETTLTKSGVEVAEPGWAPVEAEAEPPELAAAPVEATEPELALDEAEAEPSEPGWAPAAAEAEFSEPEAASGIEVAATPPGPDPELLELLLAELDRLAEMAIGLETVATAPNDGTGNRGEALLGYAEEIARLADATEAMGLGGLQRICAHVNGNLLALASLPRPLTGVEYELIAAWPTRAMRYLRALTDRDACQALVEPFRDVAWPSPLSAEEAGALVDSLVAPALLALPEMESEARPREALPEDVSLVLPEDVNPELLDSLLQELPAQTAEFSAAIQRLAEGEGDLRDVDVAQRIAHTVKGAGNTVGVRGIANLTHQMEDILLALSKHRTLPNRPLAEALLTAADCLETMSEALVGLSAPPSQAREVLQTILDWANRIDREGLPKGDEAPRQPVKPTAFGAGTAAVAEIVETAETAETAEAVAARAEPAAAVPLVRVPASLVDELLRLVGESIILTGQIQERARKALRQARAMQAQHQVFQQLTTDLEQLVEVRGIAPTPGRTSGKGDFDLLELEQYNELNTVTHRLLEAAADSRALDQDAREELAALDNLLVTQGRLHRASQEAVLRTRMIPVKTIVPRLQRSVRQTCRLTDRQVEFSVNGGETLMDSNLLADITDPLMHILRNAVDHGIEPPARRQALSKNPVGRIDLSFVREGDTIVVRCQDDGAGLDFAAIRRAARQRGLIPVDAAPDEAELSQLVLLSGFSTRTEATQTSGRGIGLDAVYSRLRELKGSLQIHSEAHRGCRVELRLPVTLIAIHALVVRVHGQRFAISSRGVEQILYAGLGEIRQWGAKAIYQLGDDFHELTSLEELLSLPPDRRAGERHVPSLLLVRESAGATRAVLVQEVLDSRDLVVKPLGRYFPKLPGIVGATILGDGGVVPVLDLPELLGAPLAGHVTPSPAEPAHPSAPEPRRRTALVVDDSLSARRALAQAVEDAGLEVRTARDGLEAVAMIETHRPDLLLVDLEMPRMNGLELTSHVRGRDATRALPVIMVTSRSTAKHRREAQAVGVNFYMTKPFADEELLQNINAALSGA